MSLDALLGRVRSDDPKAREQLLEEVYPRVKHLVHHALAADFRLHNPWILSLFSTGDVVQEVMLQVSRSEPPPSVTEEGQLLGWLAVQIHHEILDRLRFHRRKRRDVRRVTLLPEAPIQAVQGPTPSSMAAGAERLAHLEEVLATLNDRQRKLWRLRVHEDKTFAEIAAATGLGGAESARTAFKRLRHLIAARVQRRGSSGSDGP